MKSRKYDLGIKTTVVPLLGAAIIVCSSQHASGEPELGIAVQKRVTGQATGIEVLGEYQRNPVQNGWHTGTISMKGNSPTAMQWTNGAGVKWNLIPDFANKRLLTDSTSPYLGKNFVLTFSSDKVTGFTFNGETYTRKTGAVTPPAGQPSLTLKNADTGKNYSVESSSNLQDWQQTAYFAPSSNSFTWPDYKSDLKTAKFYRAKPAGPLQTYNPPAAPQITPRIFTQSEMLGTYQRLPIQNGWHEGTIAVKPSTSILQWTNVAGSKWDLIPDLNNQQLLTNQTSPYPGNHFHVVQVGGQLLGFSYNGETYTRVGTTVPAITNTKMHGYLQSTYASAIPSTHAYGFSFYSAIWPMLDKPLAGYQVGLPGTWLMPNNNDFYEAMLPPDNPMRILAPERSPWRDLFQTIEGSAGTWVTTQFPAVQPKYRLNGTFNGYINEVSSPGWGFGQTTALPASAAGLAQLSNRMLIPPDGFTFEGASSGDFLGYAWMALPIIPATTTVGDQSWTCFINAENFKGAVAFYVPDIWTRYSQVYPTVTGRGLDILPGLVGSMTMEFAQVPMKMQTSSNGSVYARVARLLFPKDSSNKTYLGSDMTLYSKAAIFTPVQNWFSGGALNRGVFADAGKFVPQISANPLGFTGGPSSTPMDGLSATVQSKALETPAGGLGLGLEWTGAGTPGVFPEYFVVSDSKLNPITKDQLPADIVIDEIEFEAAGAGTSYTSPTTWNTPAPSSPTYTVDLSDGSRIEYTWYRFVDQPAVQGSGWTTAQKTLIQTRIEQIHSNWSSTANFMSPPTGGVLASVDPAILVTPPAGLEIGYVPVVTKQWKP